MRELNHTAEFVRIATALREGTPPFSGEDLATAYDRFVSAVRAAPGSKIHLDLKDPVQLVEAPAVALLIADVVVATGGGGSELEVLVSQIDHGPVELEGAVGIPEGTAIAPAFVQFPKSVLKEWLRDAESLIQDGALVYVPRRAIIWKKGEGEGGRGEWQVDGLDTTTPWGVWRRVADSSQSGSTPLFMPDDPEQAGHVEVLSASMPFLRGMSLSRLREVLIGEGDAVASFRKAAHKAIATSKTELDSVDDPQRLRHIGGQIRRDILDPESEALERRFRSIVRNRAIRLTGASIGTLALTVSAMATGGITAIAGSGGIAMIANQYAAYREDLDKLKENPWYFVWKLKRAAE